MPARANQHILASAGPALDGGFVSADIKALNKDGQPMDLAFKQEIF